MDTEVETLPSKSTRQEGVYTARRGRTIPQWHLPAASAVPHAIETEQAIVVNDNSPNDLVAE